MLRKFFPDMVLSGAETSMNPSTQNLWGWWSIGRVPGILLPVAEPGFWKAVWEEDLRAPSRDLVNQVFYVVVTVAFDAFSKLGLGHSTVSKWLQDIIYNVFDCLTLIALAQLAFPMAIRMVRSGIRSATKQ